VVNDCYDCSIGDHYFCTWAGEDDDQILAHGNGWYTIYCCCGRSCWSVHDPRRSG
jgi:hypothetical protein